MGIASYELTVTASLICDVSAALRRGCGSWSLSSSSSLNPFCALYVVAFTCDLFPPSSASFISLFSEASSPFFPLARLLLRFASV